jgi:hypothetical protein
MLALLAGAWLVGLLCFALADGHFEATLPRRQAPPAHSHNMSALEYGPTVRASSYYADWGGHHHPLFLVDGKPRPAMVEKWASGAGDPHPWVEVLWREPHDLERVVLHHAGVVESSALTVRRYTVACLTAQGRGPSVDVEDNQDSVATHALVCSRVRGVRVTFEPNDKNDIVRVYELETWGQ